MNIFKTIHLNNLPVPLLSHIDSRDAAVWVLEPFVAEAGGVAVGDVMRLPWRVALSESSDPTLLAALERTEHPDDPMVRRRGFVQIVDANPSEIVLPPRCLPVYLLNGRIGMPVAGLVAMTRRLTMLDALRQLELKELLILAGRGSTLPPELAELWQAGLRANIIVVSDAPGTATQLEAWRSALQPSASAGYLPVAADAFCRDLLTAYLGGRADDRIMLRIRDVRGEMQGLDVTGLDDPEHPLLANYELLQERELNRIQPDDLHKEEIQNFFLNPSSSWRPYAAGMPWWRDDKPWETLRARLRRLDKDGSEAGRITYICAESGSGGTTLMRTLAWTAAEEGYPTLVAGAAPFNAKALEIIAFITRVVEAQRVARPRNENERLYETPWLLVFDHMHWEGREDELRRFLHEFERSGRPVCVLMVTGPYLGTEFYDRGHFLQITDLSHEITREQAISLGRHLNQFLKSFGAIRTESEWHGFYDATALDAEKGIAAFWITLSFWVRPR